MPSVNPTSSAASGPHTHAGHAHDHAAHQASAGPAQAHPAHPPGAHEPHALSCSACTVPGDGHNDHAGHDHGVLPGWPRIAAALVVALLAEVCHWLAQDPPSGLGWLSILGMAFALLAIGLSGLGVYRAGLKSLARGHLGIHALMAVAVTGAFLIGQWPEAAMVMALYAAAERIEDQAMDRARQAIRGLLSLAPETADVLQPDGQVQRQPVDQVALGASVRIAPGARVPLDGVVTQGSSAVDQASITGESALADKVAGDPLYAGSVNQQGELLMRVTAPPSGSLLARIVELVERAQATRAPTQRFVDRFAQVYTPIVFVLALLLAVLAPFVADWPWHQAVYQALALLVIACPCALVISTPVTVVSALTAAARRGVLIKGGSALEQARTLEAIALDKTGTLTTGKPSLVAWQAAPQANAEQTAQAATIAWQLASRSDHPVSRAMAAGLMAELRPLGQARPGEARPGEALPHAVDQVQALPGLGVQALVNGTPHVLGNLRLMRERGLADDALLATLQAQEAQGRSVTLLADDHAVLAWFAVADPLRDSAGEAVRALQALGVTPVVLSGDNPATVQHIASQAGIADARGGLLPQDKFDLLGQLRQQYGPTGMTGDGINDAPALAAADVGFAMGGAHSTAMAMETAQVVLMNDDLRRLPETVRLSRDAHRVLWQNIGLALGIKALFFALALSGQATLWMAVAADMGVSLLVVANGLRLRRWGA